jgi:hypothetical protein
LLPSWLILSFLLSCSFPYLPTPGPPKDLSKLFSFVCCCRVLIQTFKQVLSLSLSLSVVPLLSKQSSKLRSLEAQSSKAQKLRAQSSKLKASTTPPAACRSWALMMLW